MSVSNIILIICIIFTIISMILIIYASKKLDNKVRTYKIKKKCKVVSRQRVAGVVTEDVMISDSEHPVIKLPNNKKVEVWYDDIDSKKYPIGSYIDVYFNDTLDDYYIPIEADSKSILTLGIISVISALIMIIAYIKLAM